MSHIMGNLVHFFFVAFQTGAIYLVCHECSIEDQFYSSPDFKQLKCRNNQQEISIPSIIHDVSGKWQTGRNVVMNMPPLTRNVKKQ